MKKFLFVFAIALYCFSAFSQDVIYTNSGEEIKSKVIEISENKIKYFLIDQLEGPIRVANKKDIFMIIYEDGVRELFKNKENENKSDDRFSFFIDERDNKKYKIVKINNQWWMAENLSYNSNQSWCYDEMEGFCNRFGRLYTWEAAQNVCPDSWRLPSDDEWKELESALGMLDRIDETGWRGTSPGQGRKLRAGGSSGFNAILAGKRFLGSYDSNGYSTYFWSSSESPNNNKKALIRELGKRTSVNRTSYDKDFAFSVRCLKGDSETGNKEITPDLKKRRYFVNHQNTYFSFGIGRGASYGNKYGARIQHKKSYGNYGIAIHFGGGVTNKYFNYEDKDPYEAEYTYLAFGCKLYYYRGFYFDAIIHNPTYYTEMENFQGVVGVLFSFATTVGYEYSLSKDFDLCLSAGIMDIGSLKSRTTIEIGFNWKIIK